MTHRFPNKFEPVWNRFKTSFFRQFWEVISEEHGIDPTGKFVGSPDASITSDEQGPML
jgi:hypothetical protein